MKDSDGAEALEVGGDATPLPHQVTIEGMMVIMRKTMKKTMTKTVRNTGDAIMGQLVLPHPAISRKNRWRVRN